MKGYFPCHNSQKSFKTKRYDSETDQRYPTGSVFCQHGAGFYVNGMKLKTICIFLINIQKAKKAEYIS